MAVRTTGYSSAVTPKSAIALPMTDQQDDDGKQEYWSLSKLMQAFVEYRGSKDEEIQEQKEARNYRHGAQWTVDQVEIFNKRKQPVVTYNRIGRKIDAIVGLMERLKQDPKAYPRNPKATNEQGAELATHVVRYVVEGELRETVFPFSIEQAATEGIGGAELLLVRGDKGDPDIGFALVQPDSFFYDPRSYLHDFSDARWMGQGKWMDSEDVKEMFPEKADEIEGMIQSGWDLTTNPDRERRWFHITNEFKRVRVVDIWYRHKGGWCWAIFTGGGKLDEGKSYFFNQKGEPICKYIMFSSFIDHDGDRYGFVRSLRSSQDEINQRRSKGLHELNSRRIKAEDGAFADIEVARRESVRPDGVVIYNKGFEMEFDDQARIANVEGQLKFLEDAKNEIENFGPNPALIGQGLEYKSGRAINYLQQAGIAELGPFVIGVKNWKLRMYRAIWCAAQRYWTAERWLRITDDEGVAQYVQVNGVGVDEQSGMPRLVNALGNLDVNFVLDEGPDEVNMMADAYDSLVALATQGAKVPPEILIELSPVHASVKRKLLAILNRPDPNAQVAQQLAIGQGQAEIQKTQSEAQLNQAKAAELGQGNQGEAQMKMMEMGMKREEHQMKLVEGQAKIRGEQQKAQIKAQSEFDKLQSTRAKAAQDLQVNQAKGALAVGQARQKGDLAMQQAEDKHKLAMKQQAAKPQGR